jgi:hypothetical protein
LGGDHQRDGCRLDLGFAVQKYVVDATLSGPSSFLFTMSDQLLDTPAKHPFSLSGLIDSAWNRVSEAAFKTGWAPVARLSEAAVVACVFFVSFELKIITRLVSH